MKTTTELDFRNKYSAQFKHSPEFFEQIVAGAKFYGVCGMIFETKIQHSPIRFAEMQFSRETTKSSADKHLARILEIDMGDAHTAMNAITHYNLPCIYDTGIDLALYEEDEFMKVYREIHQQETEIMPTAKVSTPPLTITFAEMPNQKIVSLLAGYYLSPDANGNFTDDRTWCKVDIEMMARKVGFIVEYVQKDNK